MTDLRADRTRGYLREALMAMLKEMPFSEVTASAVAQRAGVSRSSLYNHYADLFELVEDCYVCELQHFHRSYRQLRDYEHRQDACVDLLDEYAHVLRFYEENPNFARVFIDNFCTSPYLEECRRITAAPLLDHIETEYGSPLLPYLDSQHCVHYVLWGLAGLVRAWFYQLPRPSIESTSKEIVYYMMQSLAGMMGRPIEPKYLQAINSWKLNSAS